METQWAQKTSFIELILVLYNGNTYCEGIDLGITDSEEKKHTAATLWSISPPGFDHCSHIKVINFMNCRLCIIYKGSKK